MSQVQDVKNATDIVQLIGEKVTLQRSGSSWRGLCPFHSEKSPSFFVSEQIQRYRCFGCQETGDVFTFLEKYEGMTFAEALQTLAERAGITLTKQSFSAEDDTRKRVLEILDLAKEYYHFLLTKHKTGEVALKYLQGRGITNDSIKLFQIGFSLPGWDGVIKYLHEKKKYSLSDLEAAGLIIKGNGGRYYDRFRGRVMFPLTDHRGRVVGFSGRVLEKETKEAKYINSPETMVYHKSEMLFGYSQLYQFLRKENEVLIVEGEFDVISSAQAHVNNVVAVKGSVLTDQQMKLLSRTVNKIILSFDMDSAGITATKRAIEVAKPFGLELRVIRLPAELNSKDPDELARTQPQEWRHIVKSSISVYDFFLAASLKSHNAETPEGKRKIIDELAPIFGGISHAVELEYYVEKLATALQVKTSIVKADLEKFKQVKRAGLLRTPSPKPQVTEEKELPEKETRKSRLEEYVLFLLFNGVEEQIFARAEQLKHVHFARNALRQLINQIIAQTEPFHLADFAKSLPEDLQQLLMDVSMNKKYVEMAAELDFEKEWKKSIQELINLDIAEEVNEMGAELDQLEQKNEKTADDELRHAELLRKIVQLRARQQAKF